MENREEEAFTEYSFKGTEKKSPGPLHESRSEGDSAYTRCRGKRRIDLGVAAEPQEKVGIMKVLGRREG